MAGGRRLPGVTATGTSVLLGQTRAAVSSLGTVTRQLRRTTVCVESFLRWHCCALSRRAQKQEPSIITAATLGVPLHGAGGTCALSWAAIRARSTTSHERGLTTA